MIVPMKKVSLVVMDKEKTQALDKLRELGVMHLERKQAQSDTLSKLLEKKTRSENTISLLESTAAENKKKIKKNKAAGAGASSGEESAAAVFALGEEKKTLSDQLTSLLRERVRIEKWGDFDPSAFAAFSEYGLVLIPYELTLEAYRGIGNEIKLIVLGETKTTVRVLAWGTEITGENPFALPDCSLAELDSRVEKIRGELAAIEDKFISWLPSIKQIKAWHAEIQEQIEFEMARAGMDILKENTGENFEGRTVSWIGGFIPAERLGILKRNASDNGWALSADDPSPDDQVPTLLKNNKFFSLLEPLTGFLEVVPGYDEIDVTPVFLVFFIIFFGMIFGDAGYGALLLITAVIGIFKTAKKGVPSIIKLMLLLGISNFLWGVLTCSWFGINNYDMLPAILRNISLPLISNVQAAKSSYDEKIVQQNIMIFCFSLALVQLVIGRILAILHKKSLIILSHIGYIAMLIGMYFVILFMIVSNEARRIPLIPPAVPLLAAGFILNFIFGNYDGSVVRSIIDSLKNFISVVLGITGVFSDIMSYIRLWAVGLAGAAIASTINTMAGPMLGSFILFIFGIALLLFGHGLNVVLNTLSVLVHGVRLNTLEFSGHVGLGWSGFAYKPFAKRIKKDTQTV